MLPRPPLATPTVTPFPVPTLFLSHARHIRAADPAPDGLIVASPANPTGTIIPPAELADLAAACRERGVRIISDEISHRLRYGAETHSMLQYDPDAFVIHRFSTYYDMPRLRPGWIVCPPDLVPTAPARTHIGR